MLIYKICNQADWDAAVRDDTYVGSAKDRADGFLHFSKGEQLAETLRLHYSGASDLVLIAVEADELGDALKWKTSRNSELFPHLYSGLPAALVKWTAPITRDADGGFIVPL
ncbi:MAG TPA: DUF952 domain-containing protein [Rhizomicrobium sp.]|jgi:uncharacterized protein (DUF952 family)|nr:DUF952 domain-containing protein [Rhizomicrobium sp.]